MVASKISLVLDRHPAASIVRAVFVVVLAVALLAPLPLQAQQAEKVYRIGFLRAGEPPRHWIEEFRQGLRELDTSRARI